MEQRLYAMYLRTGEIPGLPSTRMGPSDGIRDLVRSRGLGDVYKRQLYKQMTSEEEEEERNRTKI